MPSSTTTTTPPADTGFDPLVFWFHHQQKILIFLGIVVVALAAYGISEYVGMRRNDAAQVQLSTAHTVDEYRKVIAEYGGTPAAGDAYLLLAAKLRGEGKFDESNTALHTFIDKYPENQMISGAWTSLAANLEAQKKVDEALAMYQKVSTSFANSFSAPIALLAQARILAEKGRTEDARKIYEQVMAQYPENLASREANQEVRKLKK
ncbi:MAG TPA: tetratricopeptide repeat protein [Chthoniobacter sp.]|jgi:TolA-binding protein